MEKNFTQLPEQVVSESADGTPRPAKPPRDLNTISWIAVVIALFSALFLFALDQTIVADIQPRIILVFGDVEKLPWVSVAYPLGAVALNLLVSNLFMLFDNKILFTAGVVLFEIGSAVCGAAPSMNALIIGRLICGFGGVGIFVGSMNLLSVLTSETERPIYLNLVGLTWGTGTVLGPIVGGAFSSSKATWRWAFYINLCVGAVMAPIYLILLPGHNPRPGVSIAGRLRQLDWIGATLCAGGTTCLVMAISFGGALYEWNSGPTIALFVCSGVAWILFVLQQAFAIGTTRERRLFPVKYLKSRQMNILFAQTASAIVVAQVPLYFIPLFFQFARGDSALQAGVRLLPLVFFQVLGTVLSGIYLQKVGYYLPLYLTGGIFSLTGGLLFFFVKQSTTTAAIYGYSVILGLGSGLFVQASYPVAQLKAVAAEIPKVVAFIGYAQIAGITLSLSISSSAFLNTTTKKIAEILPMMPKQAVQQAVTGTGGAFLATLQDSQRNLVLNAICRTIGNIYGTVIAAAGLAILLSPFLKWESISRKGGGNGLVENDVEGRPSRDVDTS